MNEFFLRIIKIGGMSTSIVMFFILFFTVMGPPEELANIRSSKLKIIVRWLLDISFFSSFGWCCAWVSEGINMSIWDLCVALFNSALWLVVISGYFKVDHRLRQFFINKIKEQETISSAEKSS